MSNDEAVTIWQLSTSIDKHSNSTVSAAKIAAVEQPKTALTHVLVRSILRLIIYVTKNKTCIFRWAEPNIQQLAVDTILHEMKGMEEEILSLTVELNGLLCLPTKSNCSPN